MVLGLENQGDLYGTKDLLKLHPNLRIAHITCCCWTYDLKYLSFNKSL